MEPVKPKSLGLIFAALFTVSGLLSTSQAQTPTPPAAPMSVAEAQEALDQAKAQSKIDFQSVVDCRPLTGPERGQCNHQAAAQVTAINKHLADAQKALTKAQYDEKQPAINAANAARQAQADASRQAATAARQSATPNAPATQTARATPAPPQDPDVYDSKSFSGLTTWLDAFQKEANDPKAFATNFAKMKADANAPRAKMQTLVTGAERSSLQKFVTDHELYIGYYRSAANLVALQTQCLAPRPYTAAEACDCTAGFPGDTKIGPGAGELVTSSNTKKAVLACGRAAELATDPHQKARFIAQRGRAQAYTPNGRLAKEWIDEALAGGYHRAIIIQASNAVYSIEYLSTGFPVPKAAVDETIKAAVQSLQASKKAGVWETHIVARQLQEALDNLAFSNSILEPMVKSMLTPPPASPCGQDVNGDDGKPIPGTGCMGHQF
jgi:hypothetical protein